jgi:mRNA-degrading endonuclease HigB of HigAB toxin-antitoxin module
MVYIFKQIAERNEIGVRGEYAAEILDTYGIKNVRIVGCHSLFYYMKKIFHIKPVKERVASINFNFNQCYADFFQSHLEFCKTSLPVFNYFLALFNSQQVDIDYTMQTAFIKELMGYSNFTNFNLVKDFALSKGRYFFFFYDWANAVKINDITIGSQFHGCVASILAGTPALLIAVDKRMKELARYHKIPFILAEDFDPALPIDYYCELCDYTGFNKKYASSFEAFIDYCRTNGVALRAD